MTRNITDIIKSEQHTRVLGQSNEYDFKLFYGITFLRLLAILHDGCDEFTIRMDLNMDILMHSNSHLIV